MHYSLPNGQAMGSRPESLRSESLSGHAQAEGDRPRKRVRKGTRSCWECKRRKIKCQLSSEDVAICSGCVARGTSCLSQEFPEERDSSSGVQVGERLGRVEKLLETLVAKISAYEDEDKSQKILTPDSMDSNDIMSPEVFSAANTSADSYLSLFDNTSIGQQQLHPGSATPASKSASGRAPSCRRPTKTDRLRQTLTSLLPSQEDADLICTAGNCWLLVHSMSARSAKVPVEDQQSLVASIFNIAEVSQKGPVAIARTLMYMAICVQQLDPEFDMGRLHLLPTVDIAVGKYLNAIQTLITSDDELVSTMEGLECLLLQGIYYIFGGSPRRAWLLFRRALSVGQLMGIHKKSTASAIPGGRALWFQLVQADRYLALLLGLPAGSIIDPYEPDENFSNPDADKDFLFSRKLTDISTQVIERNQIESSHAYAATQDIDEKLESLAKEMPQSWWNIHTGVAVDQSSDTANHFDRLMIQIWFYQLQSLVHLPFMLRAATERRYDYSKYSCLKASREIMWRYLAMREQETKIFCCRTVDFGALTATVALLLGLLEPGQDETRNDSQQRDGDRALVHTVLQTMEQFAISKQDGVAKQSVKVIKSLLAVDNPNPENGNNLRLTIPYFGTITIVRPQPKPSQQEQVTIPMLSSQQSITVGQPGGETSWQGMQLPANPLNVSAVSFTSSQFPLQFSEQPPLVGDLGWGDSDTLFFDSLLNTDIEGNWIF